MKIRTTARVQIAPGRDVARGVELDAGTDIPEGLARTLVRLKLAVAIEAPAAPAPAPAPAPVTVPAPEPIAAIEEAPNRMVVEDAAPVRKRAPRRKAE
jgi:hypothetical protein